MFKPVSPKVDFPALERELLERWYKDGIIEKYLQKNKSAKEKFSFLDGPITANNPMGVHHAWGRTYKDAWQRFYNMRGYTQRFQNGFDEQGLWVEVEVEKELGLKSKKDIENLVPGDKFKSLEKFINLCKERVKKYSTVQTEQSKRLGYFMDWDNSYHTSSDENNYAIWHFLKVVHEKGWLYKGRDSVPWCPRCGTAISQHEILTEEYKELTHRTIVFKLKIKGRDKEYLLAWTTTPWTVPGNVSLAVDPEQSYWKMTNNKGEKIVIINPTASGDLEKEDMLVNKLGLTEGWVKEKGGELKGKDLIGLEYEAPYDHLPAVKRALEGYTHRVIASDPIILPINPAEGTGIVHIAPGAGSEDFKLGKKEKLPVIPEIDEMGVFIDGFDFLSGLQVKDGSKKVLEDLEERGLAFKISDYTHRYPTCWRCHTELVWRVVDEWYIAMDYPSHKASMDESDGKETYREMMVGVARKINWIPEWGLDRELDWLKNMHDWLISKKRYWGLSLPIWECNNCGNFEVIGSKEELNKKAVRGWDEFEGHSPHRPWVDKIKIKCEKCGEITSRIPDVGNPWLDAGIVSFSTMPADWFPADFITESFPGQFKNWFYSLIAMSTALKDTNPFGTVLGFASVRDENGEEMHKSKGNAIEFNEAADKIGVDVMRWMYARQDPEQNLNFGYRVADDVRRQFHLILWNIYNFFITYAIIDKWDPKNQATTAKESVLDTWILSRLQGTARIVTNSLEKYKPDLASHEIEQFVHDMSLWYIRRSRDRVGPSSQDENDKQAFYKTCYEVLVIVSQLIAPFLPFIAEEIYTNLTDEESVHLSNWPTSEPARYNPELEDEMEIARKIVTQAHAMRKLHNLPVRQPLSMLSYGTPKRLDQDIELLIAEEVNVKQVDYIASGSKLDIPVVTLDLKITPELQDEGSARKIIRQIQEERKRLGTKINEHIDVFIKDWPVEFEEDIKRKALVRNIIKSDEFSVKVVHE